MSRHPGYPFAPPEQTTYPAPSSSSDGPASLLGEMKHPRVPMHLKNTGGFDSSSEADQSNQVGIDKREIAGDFHEKLKEFVGHLAECKKRCELSGNRPERRKMLEVHAADGDSLITRVQALIEVSEGAIQSVSFREDGTPTQKAWDAFVKSLLGSDHQLQETRDLISHMDGWVFYYNSDCPRVPFVFLGRELDAYDLAHNLLNFAEYIHGHDSPITKEVRSFSHQLRSIDEAVISIRNHEPVFETMEGSRSCAAARAMVDSVAAELKMLWAKIRDFVTACEAAVPAPYHLEDGTPRYDAIRSFMHALLGHGGELRELAWAMFYWLKAYNTDCEPLLKVMQEEAGRRFPPRPQYEYPWVDPRCVYTPPQTPTPSTPYQAGSPRTPSPTPSSGSAPYDPSTISPHQHHDAGYESDEASSGSRPPSPEEGHRNPLPEQRHGVPVGQIPRSKQPPTREKPFVLLRRVVDAIDLADNILELSCSAYGADSPTTEPVSTFVTQLTEYGGVLMDLNDGVELCKIEQISRSRPDGRDTIRSYARGADDINACLQDLVAVCEAEMPEAHDDWDGTVTLGDCEDFTNTLLGRERETMDGLAAAMLDWVQKFVTGCAPLVTSMKREKHRIKRMREDAQRREDERRREDARRRKERGHRRHRR